MGGQATSYSYDKGSTTKSGGPPIEITDQFLKKNVHLIVKI